MNPPALSRPTYARIDLSALSHNLKLFRRHVKPLCEVLAMVKADAYGHGAAEVSLRLAAEGVKAFGVATLEEALQLRQAGLKQEILLLGPLEPRWLDLAVSEGIGITAWSKPYLDAAQQAAAKAERRLAVHLKVDTGMARLGFMPAEVPGVLEGFLAKAWPHLDLSSAYTHLTSADEAKDRFTPGQLSAFKGLPWPRGLRLHASNSSGALRYDQAGFSAVRPGIFLYGALESSVHPAARLQKGVLSLHSSLVRVETIPKGHGVSYGRTFTATKPTRVATLPIGYADGVPRSLSNQGEVLVGGRRCRILGRVCMDLCMVDVTSLRHARPGDAAVLLGRQGREEIRASEWAALAGTIAYEILCGISNRVPRQTVG